MQLAQAALLTQQRIKHQQGQQQAQHEEQQLHGQRLPPPLQQAGCRAQGNDLAIAVRQGQTAQAASRLLGTQRGGLYTPSATVPKHLLADLIEQQPLRLFALAGRQPQRQGLRMHAQQPVVPRTFRLTQTHLQQLRRLQPA